MSVPFTIITPPEPPAAPQQLHHVHIFHVIRSSFGVMASNAPHAIQAAMPHYEGVDFSCENGGVIQGYLGTLPTDKIASVLVDANPAAIAETPSVPEEEAPITGKMQILQLASALLQITTEDTSDGRFAKIAQEALDAAGIKVVDEAPS